MRYSIHAKTKAATKARILIRTLIECAKAEVKPSFVTSQILWGVSLYLECGKFSRENRRTYSRISDAARRVVESGDKNWKRKVTFEHVRPLTKMYQMLFEERKVLTLERAAFIIGEYPPILITLEEDFEITARGFQVEGRPHQRYAKIPITGFTLRAEGVLDNGRPKVAAEETLRVQSEASLTATPEHER
jgi:hypothetical protein